MQELIYHLSFAAAVVAAALAATTAAVAGPTLDVVRARGAVVCGVGMARAGFAATDGNGALTGLDVDVCRAVAAAVFADAGKVRYAALTAKNRFAALRSGDVDLLARNTTWTMSRETELGVAFPAVIYFDGQGFLVPRALGVKSALELDDTSICVQPETTTELNLEDYFRTNSMTYRPVAIETEGEMREALLAGRCEVVTMDLSGLHAGRSRLPRPDDYVLLPEIIAKEPLGPAVSRDDHNWSGIVRWSIYAMIAAEELGVTSGNVEEMAKGSPRVEIRRLLGAEGDLGRALGLPADWGYQIIKQVGNYGEAFERNLGSGSALGIGRGLNALWTQGGLMYAPPLR